MATITETKQSMPLSDGPPSVDIGSWLRNDVFKTVWHILFAIILVGANILIVQACFFADPVSLSHSLGPIRGGEVTPNALGSVILTVTDGALLTSVIVGAWVLGALLVVRSALTMSWPGVVQWLKDSLYSGFFGALISLFLLLAIIFSIRGLLSWGVFGAEFNTNPDDVAVLRAVTPGAVWGIVGANIKLFAMGFYPSTESWRIIASLGIWLLLAVLSVFAWGFGSPLKQLRQLLFYCWLASLPLILFLLHGRPNTESGLLVEVGTNKWGGFLLTCVIAILGIVISFPIGLLLALGRRSDAKGVPMSLLMGGGAVLLMLSWGIYGFPEETNFSIPLIFNDPPIVNIPLSGPLYALVQVVVVLLPLWLIGHYFKGNLIKTFSICYIELIRGVPLITVLFMANVMLPIFLPKGVEIDNVLRVVVGVILFAAAYLAENVRGGLQSIPKGQYEAAMAVGLSTAQSMRLIILPQALRAVIPAIVGQFIGLFKDTSLVAIVGLFDLLKIAQTVVSQPDWLGLQRETFAFIALIYWIFCFAMSTASRRLERNLGIGKY